MSVTLFFAKLNLVSDDLFKLYDNPKMKKEISYALSCAISSNTKWEKENIFLDDAGELHSTIIEYSARIVRIDDSSKYFEGWLYKKSRLYYKVLDEVTGLLVQQHTDNTEGIRFVLDISHGYIGYNTSARFGYKEFLEAFVNLVNVGEESCGYDFRYNIGICTSGINLDDIRQNLCNIGKIQELRIRMQPPNPSDDLLDKLQERCDGVVQELKTANVTEVEMFYSSKGTGGINLSSPYIAERIEDIQGLHSALPVEESTKKGYVTVTATSISGQKYSSGDAKPIKKIVSSLEDVFDACIQMFLHDLH